MSWSNLQAPDARPLLPRSRSHTVPSNRSGSGEEEPSQPIRPSNTAPSNSSLSPASLKPRERQTLPITASAGGIVSYAQRHGQNKVQGQHHIHRHKHTQSDAHAPRRHQSDALPNLTAGLLAERRRQDLARPTASDFLLGPRAHELPRSGSSRSSRGGDATNADGGGDARRNDGARRAISDPK